MKVTFPAEKRFLRLAMGRTFALPDSEVAVLEEEKCCCVLAVSGDAFQVVVYWMDSQAWGSWVPS